MQSSNIINVYFDDANRARTEPLYQWDYGQILQFPGLTLPTAYEAQFSNAPAGGETITSIGDEDGVLIPDEFLTTGQNVYCWIFLHTGEDDGESEYYITIPVQKRPEPSDQEPTPVQQDAITQAIAALNRAVEQTGLDVIDAAAAKVAAEAAQGAAEVAQAGAEAAQGAAESAAGRAEAAQVAAESAQMASEAAQTASEAAATAAQGCAASAYNDAERAEQAAANAGYLDMEIVDGDLIYTRTDQVDVDFALVDGDLVMEGI